MSEKDLRAMLDFASGFCERMFAKKGEVAPMWHAVKRNGEQFVEPHPQQLGKDLASAMIRAQFNLLDVVRYIYIGEAWTVDKQVSEQALQEEVLAYARQGRLHEHPDRIEIVQLQGEDYECGQIMGQRVIKRPSNGKPYLAALEILVQPGDGVQSQGRMVGMLPVRGTKQ